MAFNASLPVDHAEIVAGELRDQFNGLKTLIDNCPTNDQMNTAIVDNSAAPTFGGTLTLTISNPPTQAQVQAILNKLNGLISELSRP
jgi:hypothetical protein